MKCRLTLWIMWNYLPIMSQVCSGDLPRQEIDAVLFKVSKVASATCVCALPCLEYVWLYYTTDMTTLVGITIKNILRGSSLSITQCTFSLLSGCRNC